MHTGYAMVIEDRKTKARKHMATRTAMASLAISSIAAVFLTLSISAWAADDSVDMTNSALKAAREISEVIRAQQIYTGCKPIKVQIADLPKAAADIGLNENMIKAAIRSRLKEAQIDADDGEEFSPTLFVFIQLKNCTPGVSICSVFGYNMRLFRPALTLDTKQSLLASTWFIDGIGSIGTKTSILDSMALPLEQFIVQYLTTNRDACAQQR